MQMQHEYANLVDFYNWGYRKSQFTNSNIILSNPKYLVPKNHEKLEEYKGEPIPLKYTLVLQSKIDHLKNWTYYNCY